MSVALPYGDHNLAQALEQGAGELIGMQQMGAGQLLMASTMVVPRRCANTTFESMRMHGCQGRAHIPTTA